MALRNGLLVHGPTHWAAAVRAADGEVKVASGRKPDLGGRASESIPGVRGIAKLAEAMAVIPLVKRALPAGAPADAGRAHAGDDGRAPPCSGRRSAPPARARSAGSWRWAWSARLPALLALRGGDLAAYHGVEHKSIAAYESGRRGGGCRQGARSLWLQPGGADAHRGGGGQRRRPPGGPARGPPPRPRWGSAARPWRSRCSRGPSATRAPACRARCAGPGYEIQRLVGTREPTGEQLEVGRAALAEILRVEGVAPERPAPAPAV